MPRFRLVAFDLDGTLVDSLGDLAESANQLIVEYGGRALDDRSIGGMVGEGAAQLVARALEAAGLPKPPDALARFLAIYNARLLKLTRPYPGIGELLDRILGSQPLAVLTNKPLESTRAILGGLSLSKYFDPNLILGGDGPLPRKPDPTGLHHLAELVHASAAETLLVGDSVIDWSTARAAGAAICMARYGFGFENFPAGLASLDFVIDRPLDLASIL